MISTPQLLAQLRAAAPALAPTEHRLRHAMRSGAIPRPPLFGGRYAWSPADVVAVARHFGAASNDGVRVPRAARASGATS